MYKSEPGMWKIYREIRDINDEEEQALKNGGRRPPKKPEHGRTPNRTASPSHRVLTSIKRTDMMGMMDDSMGSSAYQYDTQPRAYGETMDATDALHLSLKTDHPLMDEESDDDDLESGSHTVRKHMRATRRALGEESLPTARANHEKGGAQLGHDEFKLACKKDDKTDIEEIFPSALILEKIGDENSGRGNTEVNLSHQGINSRVAFAFAQCLKVNTFIKVLKLKDNVLGGEGVISLCDALTKNKCLESLDLGTNGCGSEAADSICMMLSNNSCITDLSLANNKLEDEDLGRILESVKDMQKITALDISHNSGNRETGKMLGEILKSRNDSALTSLDLSWNKITHEGAISVVTGLAANMVLKSLNLSWNSLGDEAGKQLGIVIGEDKVLEFLDVSNCKLHVAMSEIAKGLEDNRCLHRLVLDNNYLGLYSGKALLRAIITQDKTKVADFNKCILVPDDFILSEIEQNWTGHYTLDCGKPGHQEIVEFLAAKAQATEGNCWRNEMINGVPFTFPWHCDHLPDKKWAPPQPKKKKKKSKKATAPAPMVLELDVISTEHPHEDDDYIEMFIFDHVVQVLEDIASDVNRIQLVRMLSLACYFKTQQVERLIEMFPYRQERVNVAVYFYNRVVDYTDYIDMLLAALGPDVMQEIARRIGPARVFNEEEPDGHYRLVMSKKEDRELFVHLVELAAGDDAGEADWQKCCFAVKLNACEHRVGPEGEALPIFEEKIPEAEAAPPEEEAPPPVEGAPAAPPVIIVDGEADLLFKIPELGALEIDYVGA